jgi:hypothetical protein
VQPLDAPDALSDLKLEGPIPRPFGPAARVYQATSQSPACITGVWSEDEFQIRLPPA